MGCALAPLVSMSRSVKYCSQDEYSRDKDGTRQSVDTCQAAQVSIRQAQPSYKARGCACQSAVLSHVTPSSCCPHLRPTLPGDVLDQLTAIIRLWNTNVQGSAISCQECCSMGAEAWGYPTLQCTESSLAYGAPCRILGTASGPIATCPPRPPVAL